MTLPQRDAEDGGARGSSLTHAADASAPSGKFHAHFRDPGIFDGRVHLSKEIKNNHSNRAKLGYSSAQGQVLEDAARALAYLALMAFARMLPAAVRCGSAAGAAKSAISPPRLPTAGAVSPETISVSASRAR